MKTTIYFAPPAQWVRSFYICPECGHGWEDEWDCACDDCCPECNHDAVAPHRTEDAEFIPRADNRWPGVPPGEW